MEKGEVFAAESCRFCRETLRTVSAATVWLDDYARSLASGFQRQETEEMLSMILEEVSGQLREVARAMQRVPPESFVRNPQFQGLLEEVDQIRAALTGFERSWHSGCERLPALGVSDDD